MRLFLGREADVWGTNMVNNPTTWHTNLMSLLDTIGNEGFQCIFYRLGDQWGGEFGITGPGAGTIMPINEAKALIDKLAGDNPLNHNFITDPRIRCWNVGNETNFGSPSSPNSDYYWIIEMCDHIRSKGGKVLVPNPIVNGDWTPANFYLTEPLLRNHVDFLEIHQYGLWHLVYMFKISDETYDWSAFQNFFKDQFISDLNNRGNFTIDQIYLGEFGIWRGINSDLGLSDYTFTDENRRDYYNAMFNAMNEAGIKNMCFHYAFEGGYSGYGQHFEVIDGSGVPLPYCYDIIKSNYTSLITPTLSPLLAVAGPVSAGTIALILSENI